MNLEVKMADFIVICRTCEAKLARKAKRQKREITQQEFEEGILFETCHSITATDDEIAAAMICPRCDGVDCEKTFLGYNVTSYIRGNGYLDKVGVRRDMNLCRLTEDDPYSEYRVAGEVDDMKVKLKRAGQHNPHKKHYRVKVEEMEEAVTSAILAPPVPFEPPTTD